MSKTHIIIGASAAGTAAAHKLRQLDADAIIIVVSDELEAPYNKCMLADYLAGSKDESQVHTLTLEQAKNKNITLMLGTRVTSIIPDQKKIILDDGQELAYDTLLLGVGTSPIIPTLPGLAEAEGVFTFHRLRDMHAIMQWIAKSQVKKAVVVGAGLSGLECADALLSHNIEVTVVEKQGQVLSSIVDAQGSKAIEQQMAVHNVTFCANEMVSEIISNNGSTTLKLRRAGRVSGVMLASGKALDADMVIFAVGLRPNVQLAFQAGVAVQDQGIITNQFMQTSVSAIYAAGDIAMVQDQLSGKLVPSRLWPDAMLQGLVAACHMAGQPRVYPGISPVISSSFFGIKFAACGPILTPLADGELITQQGDGYYHLFLLVAGTLKGFLLVGNTNAMGTYRQMVMTKALVDKAVLKV